MKWVNDNRAHTGHQVCEGLSKVLVQRDDIYAFAAGTFEDERNLRCSY